MKGRMTGIIGNTWNLQEILATISWRSPRGIKPAMRADILAALNQDKFKRAGSYATYWNGKELAAMGRLALIADELGETETAAFIRNRLKIDMDTWLLATNWNKLVYDSTWGGICSQSSMQNVYADFGLGWYNDHHFHYGYFVYAAAALGKGDYNWLMSRRKQIVDIVRDFANPSKSDPFFPVTRNKDWYDGHSWAAGLFNFGDSKNQESSSEAVNAYYGVYLLGEALGDQYMSLYGRLLLATEIRSVQKYWHIKSGSEIYESPYAAHKVVGVLWSGKVDYTTFFGGLPEYVHGIQKLPFTPISEQLLDPSWVAEEHTVASTILTRTTPPVSDDWKAFTVMSGSIINPQTAWNQAKSLRYFDNGNTRTNTYYFIATR
jgi:endo-1,3(4)-beta-glucanase